MTVIRTHSRWLSARLRRAVTTGSERGDVPGWVMVTLMTAGIVAALWVFAEDQLTQMFQDALTSVRGGGG